MQMKRFLALLLAAVLLAAVPAAVFADGETMYIKTSSGESVRMRCSPGAGYETVTKVPYGAAVTAYERIENGAGEMWVHVNYWANNQKYDGYICLRYLSYSKPGGRQSDGSSSSDGDGISSNVFSGFNEVGETCYVIPSTPGNFVNLRWAPSKSAPVMTRYYEGQELYVLAENRYWCQVYDEATGNCGFMSKTLTSRGL